MYKLNPEKRDFERGNIDKVEAPCPFWCEFQRTFERHDPDPPVGRDVRLLHPPVAQKWNVACYCSDDHMALWQTATAQRTPKLAVITCHCPLARKQGPAHGVGRALRLLNPPVEQKWNVA